MNLLEFGAEIVVNGDLSPSTTQDAAYERLDALERRALAAAQGAAFGVEGPPPVGARLADTLEACFAEARAILAEQWASRAPPRTPSATPGMELLSAAERRVFTKLTEGKSNKVIAWELSLAEATIKAHVSKILKKFKAHSRNHAVAKFMARRNGQGAFG